MPGQMTEPNSASGRAPTLLGRLAAILRPPAATGLAALTLLVLIAALIWWLSSPGAPAPETSSAGQHAAVKAERARAMASLREVESPIACTDRGRRIRLFTMPESALPRPMLQAMEEEMAHDWGHTLRLLRTAPPDRRSDCHGWIFADGQFWIHGQDMEAILEDNRYQAVTSPQAGDLVVYRRGPVFITHSAIVFAVEPDGAVLVKSKWSWLGTYLHAVNDHPYGGHANYYRSSRPTHRLAMVAK
jgi:hypothetical protein